MIRVKPQTKRKIAGIVAFVLALVMIFSSVSFLFIGNANACELTQITEVK